MTNVLIIGATSLVGQKVTKHFLEKTDDHLTLMARNTSMLSIDEKRERVVQGDVIDDEPLYKALNGNETVFIAMDSNLAQSVQRIVNGMDRLSIKRLLFITSMGVNNEIPVTDGASGNLAEDALLRPYRDAIELIENSDLNYTIIRSGQFDGSQDTNYVLSHNGEDLQTNDVSLNSVADLVIKLTNDNSLDSHDNLGISRVA